MGSFSLALAALEDRVFAGDEEDDEEEEEEEEDEEDEVFSLLSCASMAGGAISINDAGDVKNSLTHTRGGQGTGLVLPSSLWSSELEQIGRAHV